MNRLRRVPELSVQTASEIGSRLLEPPRVFRRLFRLSHAAIAGLASMA